MRVFLCESCGGPIDAPWSELVITCAYCGCQNYPGRPGGPVPARVPADDRPRCNLGGRTWVLEGELAQGESSRVFRARWVVRLGELVVLKVLQSNDDADLLRREWHALEALQRSQADGADHYVTRLPVPIAHGLVDSDRERTASVFGWKSGFLHSLSEIRGEHRAGVPGEVVVWIWKRVLEVLGFIHRAGWVHGAVHPDHIVVHPRDHGAMLVGWTSATACSDGRTERLPAMSQRWRELYPDHGGSGLPEATPELDIVMASRAAQCIGGWSPDGRQQPPSCLGEVMNRACSGAFDDAWELGDAVTVASQEDFGAPAYNPLTMPGWGH